MKVYFFGWPGRLGGADTKLDHLLPLLRTEFDLTVVPMDARWQRDPSGKRKLDQMGIRYALLNELPERLDGWGVALCNGEFLDLGVAIEARKRGLRLAWSNEMMWLFPQESGALVLGLFDAVLYVSEAQRRVLEPQYLRILSGEAVLRSIIPEPGALEGWIEEEGAARRLRWVMTGNYIDPNRFPSAERRTCEPRERPLVVGRLSRPDPMKFPPDFPYFYENLGLRSARFRVMGWSQQLAANWLNYTFDERWELLPPLAEDTSRFLQSLDLFVYSLHPSFRESWGRVVVEAMLSGAIPLVPAGDGHHLENLVSHGESGFICANREEFGQYARLLEADATLRESLSARVRSWAQRKLCDPEEHRAQWRRLFYGSDDRRRFAR